MVNQLVVVTISQAFCTPNHWGVNHLVHGHGATAGDAVVGPEHIDRAITGDGEGNGTAGGLPVVLAALLLLWELVLGAIRQSDVRVALVLGEMAGTQR